MICPICGKDGDCVVKGTSKSVMYNLNEILHKLQFQIDELKKYVHPEIAEEIAEKIRDIWRPM